MKALQSLKSIKMVSTLSIIMAATAVAYSFVKLRNDGDCFVSDQTYKLSSNTVENTHYSVYAVISGFQEKSIAFHLFKEPVSFNLCGQTADKPIYTVTPDFDYGELTVTNLNVLGASQIEIKTSKETMFELENIKVSWLP